MEQSEKNIQEEAGLSTTVMSRREALKKAGWTLPAIVGVSLLNTATTMSGTGHHGGGGKGGGGKGKGGGGKGKGGGGKGKGGGGKGKGGGKGGK